jgi:hypothetical protein
MNMACTEGDTLKSEVLNKIEDYLQAEQAQNTGSAFDEEFSRMRAELAHRALTDARQRYLRHLKLHNCDTAAILAMEPHTFSAIAV